jgi:hypothetical protein
MRLFVQATSPPLDLSPPPDDERRETCVQDASNQTETTSDEESIPSEKISILEPILPVKKEELDSLVDGEVCPNIFTFISQLFNSVGSIGKSQQKLKKKIICGIIKIAR